MSAHLAFIHNDRDVHQANPTRGPFLTAEIDILKAFNRLCVKWYSMLIEHLLLITFDDITKQNNLK